MGSNVGSNMSSGNIDKLTALKIKKIRKAGRYSDGNCLYLVDEDTGARQWVLRLVIGCFLAISKSINWQNVLLLNLSTQHTNQILLNAADYGSLNDVWIVLMMGKIKYEITDRLPEIILPDTFIPGNN